MMTKLRTIAKAGGWEVVQDVNGIISIHFGNAAYICNHASAYEAIVAEVKDSVIRKELIRQWSDDRSKMTDAEAQTSVVEAILGKRTETKDLVEELGS